MTTPGYSVDPAGLSADDRRTAAGFDRLVPLYEPLAWTFLGGGIQSSQERLLDRVTGSENALIIGGGTGWFLARLLERGFRGQILYVDVSSRMLDRSRRQLARVDSLGTRRVEFRQGTVGAIADDERFDLICTHYFLDLFEGREFENVVRRLYRAWVPGGAWMVSDFTEPHGGAIRRRAQAALLRGLYTFFVRVCAIRAHRLPPIREAIRSLDCDELAYEQSRAALLWSGLYRKRLGRL